MKISINYEECISSEGALIGIPKKFEQYSQKFQEAKHPKIIFEFIALLPLHYLTSCLSKVSSVRLTKDPVQKQGSYPSPHLM